jgi:glycerol kinase
MGGSVGVGGASQQDASGLTLAALRVDGGASANAVLMQLQADLLGVPVVRPADVETTARGAALAAGVGVGLWTAQSIFEPQETAAETDRRPVQFTPSIDAASRSARVQRWDAAVQHSLGWAP